MLRTRIVDPKKLGKDAEELLNHPDAVEWGDDDAPSAWELRPRIHVRPGTDVLDLLGRDSDDAEPELDCD